MKRLYCSLVAVCLAFCLAGSTALSAPEFSDVKTDDWFHGAVLYCLDKGIMKGVLSPLENATRAQLATIMMRLSEK